MSGTDARFAHLTCQQRNLIFTRLQAVRNVYERRIITTEEFVFMHEKELARLARKYGIKEPVIRAVYGHVYQARQDARVDAQERSVPDEWH